MPLHALSDLSNTDSTASPTLSNINLTGNLTINNQFIAASQITTLSSDIINRGYGDMRYGNTYTSILTSDSTTVFATSAYVPSGITLTLSSGVYFVTALIYPYTTGNNTSTLSSTGIWTIDFTLSASNPVTSLGMGYLPYSSGIPVNTPGTGVYMSNINNTLSTFIVGNPSQGLYNMFNRPTSYKLLLTVYSPTVITLFHSTVSPGIIPVTITSGSYITAKQVAPAPLF